jgi:hypothetical protein
MSVIKKNRYNEEKYNKNEKPTFYPHHPNPPRPNLPNLPPFC